jgi:DNA polymerase-3 subunit gamma/tau
LQEIVADEGLTAEPDALTLIARQATGAMRDAESLLDQLAASASGSAITLTQAQATLGAGPIEIISAVAQGLADGDTARGLDAINRALDRGADARQLARQITDHLRQLMLIKVGGDKLLDIPSEQRPTMDAQAARLQTQQIIRAVKLFNQAASDLRTSWQPQLPLELAYVEAVLGERPASVPASNLPPAGSTPAPASTHTPPAPPAPPASRPATPSQPARTAPPAQSKPASTVKPAASKPAAETPAVPNAALSLDAVQRKWAHVLEVLKTHNLPTQALMRSCKPLNVESSTLVLSWPSEMLRSKYEDAKTKRLVEDVISEAVGSRVITRCVVSAKTNKPDDDPLVQEAIKLGGRVVNT